MPRPSRQGMSPMRVYASGESVPPSVISNSEQNVADAATDVFRSRTSANISAQVPSTTKSKRKMKHCIPGALVGSVFVLVLSAAGAQGISTEVHRYLSEVRSGYTGPVPGDIRETVPVADVIPIAETYLEDSLPLVRTKALELIHLMSAASSQATVRQSGVDALLRRYRLNDKTNMNSLIIAYLKTYSSDDFSPSTKDRITELVKMEPPYLERWVRIAGFLKIDALRDYIRPWSQPGNPAALRWSSLLALARMGDDLAKIELATRTASLPLNDDVVYDIFPDLVYTRSHELFTLLVKALHDERKNCRAADAERDTGIACGYRVMELLAPVIRDFPLKVDPSGDLIVSDYEDALATARRWFNTNPHYTIITDKY